MYIIIELFDKTFPIIVTDIEGIPLIFKDKDEAELEAKDCQNGLVVDIN